MSECVNEITRLINQGRIKLEYTKKSRYPLVYIDEKLICETELEQYGFSGIDDFESWLKYNKFIE